MGSQELYDWLDREPGLFRPSDVDYVHSPERIGQMSNVISINGGVELDLMGQENAESAGARQLSGIGGQLDFLEGAFRSKGGKGFICLNSTHQKKDGTLKSNIVPCIPAGSVVSPPYHDPVCGDGVRGRQPHRPVPAGAGPGYGLHRPPKLPGGAPPLRWRTFGDQVGSLPFPQSIAPPL